MAAHSGFPKICYDRSVDTLWANVCCFSKAPSFPNSNISIYIIRLFIEHFRTDIENKMKLYQKKILRKIHIAYQRKEWHRNKIFNLFVRGWNFLVTKGLRCTCCLLQNEDSYLHIGSCPFWPFKSYWMTLHPIYASRPSGSCLTCLLRDVMESECHVT